MVSQLALLGLVLNFEFNYAHCLSLGLVLAIWLHTFLRMVPVHRNMTSSLEPKIEAQKLTKHNWFRTVLWSVVFILEFIYAFNTKLTF